MRDQFIYDDRLLMKTIYLHQLLERTLDDEEREKIKTMIRKYDENLKNIGHIFITEDPVFD